MKPISQYNINVHPGTDFGFTLGFYEDEALTIPIDVSGYDFFSQVRNEPKGRLLANMEVDMTDAATGSVGFSIKASDTDRIGEQRGHYDIIQALTEADPTSWYAVKWAAGLGLFIAVGGGANGGKVATSPDGQFWTICTGVPDHDWKDVCWAEDQSLLVAVSTEGAVMTSPNGEDWTERTIANGTWLKVCYSQSLGLFCAIDLDGTSGKYFATSPDGIAWTLQSSTGLDYMSSIRYSDTLGLFIGVGRDGGTYLVATSPDGINWTVNTDVPQNSCSGALATHNDISIFINDTPDDTSMANIGDPTSTWFEGDSPEGTSYWYDLIYGKDKWVAVGGNNSLDARAATSEDGGTWTVRTGLANLTFTGIDYSPELDLYVSVGKEASPTSTPKVITSKDGINWISRRMPQIVLESEVILEGEVTVITPNTDV